jgi:hypothetical protein
MLGSGLQKIECYIINRHYVTLSLVCGVLLVQHGLLDPLFSENINYHRYLTYSDNIFELLTYYERTSAYGHVGRKPRTAKYSGNCF